MKKTLISMAIMAMAGTVFAQSSAQIYGQIDYGFADKKESDSRFSGIKSSNADTSYIGLKGSEDLGNGASANFVLEYGATETEQFEPRKAYVGLKAEQTGEFRIGLQNTLMNELIGSSDVMGGSSYLGGSIVGSEMYIARAPMIRYIIGTDTSNVSVAYATERNGTEKTSAYEFGLTHAQNGIKLGASYMSVTEKETDSDSKGKYNSFFGTVSYDAGVVIPTYSFLYGKVHDIKVGGESLPLLGKVKIHQLGAVAPVDKMSLHANYLHGKVSAHAGDDSASVPVHGYQLGAKYNFSKRTNAYAMYGHETRNLSELGHDSVKNKTYSIGLSHKF
jgi:predicted porin